MSTSNEVQDLPWAQGYSSRCGARTLAADALVYALTSPQCSPFPSIINVTVASRSPTVLDSVYSKKWLLSLLQSKYRGWAKEMIMAR